MANLSSKTGTITTPVQTQISLANNATTSVQDMSAYDAQEVMGFVYVDATADLRAYFTVTVVKNGAGTYEIAGADVAGDQSGTGASAIAPVSFSMSGSILQATLPNITGFVSAYLRYQLSAPYLGGNYPLTVSARQVTGDVSGTAVPAGYIGERLEKKTTVATAFPGANGGWGDATFSDATQVLPLTAGTWSITAVGYFTNGTNVDQYYLGVGTAAGSSASDVTLGDTAVRLQRTASSDVASLVVPPFVVTLNSTTNYRVKLVANYPGGTNPTYVCRITAVRIA